MHNLKVRKKVHAPENPPLKKVMVPPLMMCCVVSPRVWG